METKRESDQVIRVPKQGDMKIDAVVFARPEIKVEQGALEQLVNAASLPTVEHAYGMPDIHHGYGVPIGSVVACRDIVVPAAVGYDVNCGMRLLVTSLSAAEADIEGLAESVKRDIPLGEGKSNVSMSRDDFAAVLEGGLAAMAEMGPDGHRAWHEFGRDEQRRALSRVENRGSLPGKVGAVPDRAVERGRTQLGTLGGGNHFVEFQTVDQVFDKSAAERLGIFKGQLTIMVHSGSRAFGHEIGGHYMKLAKSVNQKNKESAPAGLNFLRLGTREADDYIGAMNAAANFAFANRALMASLVVKDFKYMYPDASIDLVYDVPHNIAKMERHGGVNLLVHRKGSTRAWDRRRMADTEFSDFGQPVLIPGSMGTASYVLRGIESGKRSLWSVNHGAGRTMSRSAAAGGRKGKGKKKAAISDQDFKESMKGVYLIAENRRAVKEEAPAAYKDIDSVIRTVTEAGLAESVARLRPKAVMKG